MHVQDEAGPPEDDPEGAGPIDAGRMLRTIVANLVSSEIPFLKRIARRWRPNQADAEDLVQDTIVRMLAGAHSWEEGTNFRAWAFVVMRNQFRATWGCAKQDAEAAAQMLAARQEIVDEICLVRLTIRDVEAALRRLPASQRDALTRVGIEGKSYEAVAGEMGISVAAVRCHLARARERLRQAVLAEGDASLLARSRPAGRGATVEPRVVP